MLYRSTTGRKIADRARRSAPWIVVVAAAIAALLSLLTLDVQARSIPLDRNSPVASNLASSDARVFVGTPATQFDLGSLIDCDTSPGPDGISCTHATCAGIAGIAVTEWAPVFGRNPKRNTPLRPLVLRAGEPSPDLRPPRHIS